MFAKRSMKTKTLIVALLLATPGFATEHNQLPDLTITCNEHGAKVVPNEGILKGQTIYLGKDGDALIEGIGSGKWFTAASGFIVEISRRNSVRFNGDPPCS